MGVLPAERRGGNELDDDHAFAAYALILTALIASVITATIATGVTQLPSPASFFEHLALSFLIRAGYKGFGGFDWADWSVTSGRAREVDAGASAAMPGGATA